SVEGGAGGRSYRGSSHRGDPGRTGPRAAGALDPGRPDRGGAGRTGCGEGAGQDDPAAAGRRVHRAGLGIGEREAVVATKDEIVKGYARALLEVAEAEDDLGTVEDELFAFAKAMERDGRLFEALTDPALPAQNKRGLVNELLGDRANPHTVSILGF